MTALQLIVSEVLRHQLGRAGSDVPPPRLSGSSEPANSQVAEPDPTADHKHQSRPALPWGAAARGVGGTCPLVRGGVVTGAQHPACGPAGWWLPPGCPGRHPVGPRSSKSVRAMPRLAPRSGRDAAWRKERANGIHDKRPGPAPYLHRNPCGRHRCRCDRRGSGRHVRGVTCRVHVDGDNVVVTVGIAFRVTVASLYAPRGKSGALARI
jgi:hypothetical protein